VSSLPAVPAFKIVSRALFSAGLLTVFLIILGLTGEPLGVLALFLSAIRDVMSLLPAILAKNGLSSSFGVEKGTSRVVARIADLMVGQVIPFEFAEFVDRILHRNFIDSLSQVVGQLTEYRSSVVEKMLEEDRVRYRFIRSIGRILVLQ